jgi:hypothetical protein
MVYYRFFYFAVFTADLSALSSPARPRFVVFTDWQREHQAAPEASWCHLLTQPLFQILAIADPMHRLLNTRILFRLRSTGLPETKYH